SGVSTASSVSPLTSPGRCWVSSWARASKSAWETLSNVSAGRSSRAEESLWRGRLEHALRPRETASIASGKLILRIMIGKFPARFAILAEKSITLSERLVKGRWGKKRGTVACARLLHLKLPAVSRRLDYSRDLKIWQNGRLWRVSP